MAFHLPFQIPKKKYIVAAELLLGILCTIGLGFGLNKLIATVTDQTVSWQTYVDPTFGFVIKYPQGLTLTPIPIDVAKARSRYEEYCQTHEGCGGTRWPEYVLNFQTEEHMSVFILDIHQLPVSKSLGGVEHEGFTFAIRRPYNIYYFETKKDIAKQYISENDLHLIQKSIRFIAPPKPLSCLWKEETMGLPTTYRALEEYAGKIASVSGYFFDIESRTCKQTAFDIWVYEKDSSLPPFTSQNYCEALCQR